MLNTLLMLYAMGIEWHLDGEGHATTADVLACRYAGKHRQPVHTYTYTHTHSEQSYTSDTHAHTF